ncbi:hypothetical protein EVAR_39688_1 [Eumeta japonica]|uniref:Mariner Mos1 transposase n=1 Tax=Eumeta variegata TaxID=151549 RepID=A0A4C1W5G6_EUMVA|nr:hypothetical protein EVAR_39688_1 [Eumeta japonica]
MRLLQRSFPLHVLQPNSVFLDPQSVQKARKEPLLGLLPSWLAEDEKNVELMSNPAYSPDLASWDFFVCENQENQLCGQRFSSPEEAVE